MANLKLTLEAEVSDEVIAKIFEVLKLPSPEEVKPEKAPELPRLLEIEVSNVSGKVSVRLQPSPSEKGEG